MTFDVNVTILFSDRLPSWLTPLLNALGDRIMSALDDAIAAATAEFTRASASSDAAIARVQSDLTALGNQITDLQTQIATLQAQAASGGASQANLDAIAALTTNMETLQAKYDKLDQATPATP